MTTLNGNLFACFFTANPLTITGLLKERIFIFNYETSYFRDVSSELQCCMLIITYLWQYLKIFILVQNKRSNPVIWFKLIQTIEAEIVKKDSNLVGYIAEKNLSFKFKKPAVIVW